MKVTFGFVNCNRLYYLRSCLESLLECTQDYQNKEIIIIDNASVESGTDEYLADLKRRGHKVFKFEKRDPSNEYAKALNLITENSTGDIVCPLPADTQFVLSSGWLTEYVKFLSQHENNIGCIGFDAQREVRNKRHRFSAPMGDSYKFSIVYDKNPIMGAANVMFSRKILEMMYPWEEHNDSHEGGHDSETKMLIKVRNFIREKKLNLFNVAPIIPPSIGIYNEDGDNARVRGTKRYGKYNAPQEQYKYYEIREYNKMLDAAQDKQKPLSIEKMARSVGWKLPIDESGNWIKNPMKIENATENDYEEIK
jgi:glycosyltransferase involved in cell wall biosynthesis